MGGYEIVAKLGAGGMGEVYRARDPRLGRDVAIKVLPESLAKDPERLARLEREARVLATLNHTHIAQVYGLEGPGAHGVVGIVMEFVDGETLADRIRRGPLKVSEALVIARQIADALDAAHEKGIVHRDLKPSNVALTRDGAVKILDFGLAKDASTGATDPTHLTHSPTMLAHTMTGVLLGTAPYMSPEQARGKTVDKRTDIWAFGCVLYEMLTGKRAFDGETTTDAIAAILEREPDWSRLPSSLPPSIDALIRQCLVKDPQRRLRDIGDARFDAVVGPAPAPPRLPWVAAAVATIIAIGALVFAFAWRGDRSTTMPAWAADGATLSIPTTLPASGSATLPNPGLAISRDGRFVAWVANPRGTPPVIFLNNLATGETRRLEGTEGAANPFWSPDGRTLAFQSQSALKTLDVASNSIRTVMPNPEVSNGGTWSENGIVLSVRYELVHVSPSGGPARVVASLNPAFHENSLRFPRFLPDGRHFLYVARSGRSGESGAYVGSIDANEKPRRLFSTSSWVEYAPPGYLLYAKEGELVAQSFDVRTFEPGTQFVTVSHRIGANAGGMSGHFSVSANGVLALLQMPTTAKSVLRWRDRTGAALGTMGTPELISNARVAPDGRRVAYDVASDHVVVRDVWVTELGATPTRITFGGSDDWQPFWSPDGRQLAFMSYRNGPSDLYVKALDAGTPEKPLIESGDQEVSGDWSRDGKSIAYWVDRVDTHGDVLVRPLDGEQSVRVAATPANERRPRFSPDGRFLAYESDESGRVEIYVQPYPPTGGKWQISLEGGTDKAWRADGKELYYVDRAGNVIAVPVTSSSTAFATGAPVKLFSIGAVAAGAANQLDAAPDGKRFLVREGVESPPQPITVMLNWTARLAGK